MVNAVPQPVEEFLLIGVRLWLMGELRESLLLKSPIRSFSLLLKATSSLEIEIDIEIIPVGIFELHLDTRILRDHAVSRERYFRRIIVDSIVLVLSPLHQLTVYIYFFRPGQHDEI